MSIVAIPANIYHLNGKNSTLQETSALLTLKNHAPNSHQD